VLLERLDDIRLAPGTDLTALAYEPSYILHGLQRLPLVFTKRAARDLGHSAEA
jgi:hypothetical protein